uniref:EGF-like domain-containing protein n=1 Tax=Palpitomonas bilix TaxID=652834 RepID=A0A7S3GCR2_9EUKA
MEKMEAAAYATKAMVANTATPVILVTLGLPAQHVLLAVTMVLVTMGMLGRVFVCVTLAGQAQRAIPAHRAFFGSNCTACPSCGSGVCVDGLAGNGTCICDRGWGGAGCDACAANYFGSTCSVCVGCSLSVTSGAPHELATTTLPVNLQNPDNLVFTGSLALSSNELVLAAGASTDGEKGKKSGALSVWQRADVSIDFDTVTPIKLVDPDGASYDSLGLGYISLSSDGLILAAASNGDSEMGSSSGSILVWQRDSVSVNFSTVTPIKLVDPDGAKTDNLGGGGVSLSGSGLVLAASSFFDDDMGKDSGSVLVWQRSNLSSNFNAMPPVKLLDAEGRSYHKLGWGGVSLSADGLVLVAASHSDSKKGSSSGSVLVWQRPSLSTNLSTIIPVKLVDPNGASYDYLGVGSLRISANGLVISAGATEKDDTASNSGAILVWIRTNMQESFNNVTPIVLVDPDGGSNQKFGSGFADLSSNGAFLTAVANRYVVILTIEGQFASFKRLEYSYLTAGAILSPSGGVLFTAAEYGVYRGVAMFQQACPARWTGSACDECQKGFFGPSCSPCTCEHGVCADGVTGNGSCSCVYSTGSKCETIKSIKLVDPDGHDDDYLGRGGVTVSSNGLVLAAGAYETIMKAVAVGLSWYGSVLTC